jgi:4a-hydroxytetrahydrobiopterin dehydratase
MNVQTTEQLTSKRCVPCEGGIDKCSIDQALKLLEAVVGWTLIDQGRQIRRDWKAANFKSGMAFLNKVADLAEQEGHHPDVHLEGFRHLWISIWTHAIGGLSENDFILAAKIDELASAAKLVEWT